MALSPRAKTYTIAQAVLSGLGLITTLPAAGIFFLVTGISVLSDPASLNTSGPILIIIWTSLLLSVLFAYTLIYAMFRLQGKPIPGLKKKWAKTLTTIAAVVWVMALLLMVQTAMMPQLGFAISPFVLPLIIIPLILFTFIGARKLSMGNQHRIWGAITFNFSVTMPVILILELLVFLVIFIFAAVWLSNQPALLNQIMLLSEEITSGQIDPMQLERMLSDIFSQPLVLNGSLFVIAILVPLLEEFFKPVALFFLAGKKLTPEQGFVGGLVAGACFALLESLGAIGIPQDFSWFGLLVGRTGTGLLHITLSGLVGWGLASAFSQGNWLRGIGNYLLAVTMHGVWNLFALLSGIVPVLHVESNIGQLPRFLSQIGPFVLVALALLNFFLLVRINQRFRKQHPILTEESTPA